MSSFSSYSTPPPKKKNVALDKYAMFCFWKNIVEYFETWIRILDSRIFPASLIAFEYLSDIKIKQRKKQRLLRYLNINIDERY